MPTFSLAVVARVRHWSRVVANQRANLARLTPETLVLMAVIVPMHDWGHHEGLRVPTNLPQPLCRFCIADRPAKLDQVKLQEAKDDNICMTRGFTLFSTSYILKNCTLKGEAFYICSCALIKLLPVKSELSLHSQRHSSS